VGVDYGGPFNVRVSPGRGHKSRKCYIALFVCLVTRAVHIELVSDYTTSAFIAAFERFSSRRGPPTVVFSDNGTNFKGAEREIATRIKELSEDDNMLNGMSTKGISWNFIPPHAPHFGGLWEAGIKSAKHHLKRIIGQYTPIFEEFATLLCKIECCLNSRPLAPLHDDPESYDVLTPGHFLVGTSLDAVPEKSYLEITESRLTRWQAIQKMHERFWTLWSSEYLNHLQQRVKWKTIQNNLHLNDMVLMRNNNLPPTKWALARVIELQPGKDGLVRVVRVKTATATFVRPVTQLCKLFID